MDSGILVEGLPLIGNCCLCLKESLVKSMLIKEDIGNETENYSSVLHKCFSIDIQTLDLDDTKCFICKMCMQQLMSCYEFRKQVELSLKSLEASWRLQKAEEEEKLSIVRVKKENLEDNLDNQLSSDGSGLMKELKQESVDSDFNGDNIGDDLLHDLYNDESEDEYQPKTRRKKPSAKKKLYSDPKISDVEEVKQLLSAGLFPFKINKDGIYLCSVCCEKYENLDNLKSHVSGHDVSTVVPAFRKMEQSNAHKFKRNSTMLTCKTCLENISNYEELQRHIKMCVSWKVERKWNKLPFKLEKDQLDCPICKKQFLNFVTLNTHMNVHYPNYTCESCGKAFASGSRLRGHLRTHEVGNFPCRFCDAVFDKITKRENHVSKEHKSGVRYSCKRCGISLTSFYARQKHLAEVHNEELKRYKCKACTQSYITPGHLSSHVRRDHLNERNHQCSKCDLAFYTRNSLKMHMIKHDGERIFSCVICNKSYQRKKTLREHMRIHDNDKRFVCPVCGRAFTQKCTLKGHLKVHERSLI
ncbi:zinc finger protein 846-like [Leptidea sinapis]|uniref:zinc finger protein 846-like n=1 Tax=Leptidea sinapis TaxID=189913 RepID=UPI002144D7DA|nr:zinc finger protein 846-like [Leptidea sinapis]